MYRDPNDSHLSRALRLERELHELHADIDGIRPAWRPRERVLVGVTGFSLAILVATVLSAISLCRAAERRVADLEQRLREAAPTLDASSRALLDCEFIALRSHDELTRCRMDYANATGWPASPGATP
jgi:hypothetical protein